MSCTPSEAHAGNILGSAALLAIRGAAALQRAGGTAHNVVRAADTHHKLCGGLGGKGGAPREVTRENEPFVTISFHAHLQLASAHTIEIQQAARQTGLCPQQNTFSTVRY